MGNKTFPKISAYWQKCIYLVFHMHHFCYLSLICFNFLFSKQSSIGLTGEHVPDCAHLRWRSVLQYV